MPEREHTDPKALEAIYAIPSPEPAQPRNWRLIWTWMEEQFWKEKVEAYPVPDPVARRIRVHRVAVRYARKLAKIDQNEAADILVVTAMLLGFDGVTGITRRAQGARR
jgi:hypothetical protein